MKIRRFQQFFTEDDGGGSGGENEESVTTEPSQSSKEFHARFAHNRAELQPQPPSETTKEGAEEGAGDPPPEVKKAPEIVQKKLGGSNVPKILEEKRKAEAEREEYKTRLEKFEKEEKPTLEAKIADLEKKINEGGHTAAQEKVLQDKLEAAETKLLERESSLVNENKELRSRLSFHDLQSDPDFSDKYVSPIKSAYTEALDTFQGDKQKMDLLRKAVMANGAALNTTDPSERQSNEKERNNILSQIADSMDDFTSGQFTQAMNAYIRATKTHAQALIKHEETRQEIIKTREAARARGASETFAKWTNEAKRTESEFEDVAKIDADLAETIKELKLDPSEEVQQAGKTLEKVITGRASMEESIKMLHQGRVYPALVAKTKAQQHQINSLKATIAKLKNTKAGGDSRDGREHTTQTKEDINHRFRASRPGINGRE